MPSRRFALPHSPPHRSVGRAPYHSFSRSWHSRPPASVVATLWASPVWPGMKQRARPHEASMGASSNAVSRKCAYICVYKSMVIGENSLKIKVL